MTSIIPVFLTQDDIWHLLNASFRNITTLNHLTAYKKMYNAYTGNKNNNSVLHPDLVYQPVLPDKIEKLCENLDLDYEGVAFANGISYEGVPIGHTVIRNNKTYFHVDYPLMSSDAVFLEKLNDFLDKCIRVEVIKVSQEDVGRGLPNNYYKTVVYKFK